MLGAVCTGVRDREHLTYVDVSENAMGPDGVEACRPAIEGKKELGALFMCNDGLSEAAMESVRVRMPESCDLSYCSDDQCSTRLSIEIISRGV